LYNFIIQYSTNLEILDLLDLDIIKIRVGLYYTLVPLVR